MSKTLLLFSMLFFSSNLFATNDPHVFITSKSNLSELRGVEIRYVKNHPVDQPFIRVDDTKFPVFNSKEEAISYVEAMAVKRDLTIVYVRSVSEKETEFTDIIE